VKPRSRLVCLGAVLALVVVLFASAIVFGQYTQDELDLIMAIDAIRDSAPGPEAPALAAEATGESGGCVLAGRPGPGPAALVLLACWALWVLRRRR